MKQVFILIASFISLAAQAQKVLIGFNFSTDYDHRTLKNSDGSSTADIVIKSRNDETARFGYTTGLNASFSLSKQFALETGIQYSNKGYQRKGQYILMTPIDPTAPVKVGWVYAYQYIGIPVKATCSFGKSRLRFITGIGFTTSLLINYKQSATYEYANGRTEKRRNSTTSGFNKIDLSPMISAGASYKLNKHIQLFAEPTFRYGLIRVKDAPVSEKLWNAGLNVGMYYVMK